ncbi:glutathione S-transferase family protein [Luminiphilus sp.]|nr:glutathione S-transferase family protein [Luminiphilus sp.]
MRLKPVYATDPGLVDKPLTDVPSRWAPKKGIHLYHFPLSLDSQKVRQGLEEIGIDWQSHVILLPAQQQFSPSYARINSRCVVPTLVIDGRVTTDSVNILAHLADRFGVPKNCFTAAEHEKEDINYWVDKAAALFIEALTYGHIEGVKKPFPLGNVSQHGRYHQNKIELLSRLIERYQHDETLKVAYEKKRAVIEATHGAIATPSQLAAIVESTKAELSDLEQQLSEGPFDSGGWLVSDALSLADIQWGVVLYRLRWLGLEPLLWKGESRITSYADRVIARESFQRGIIQWSKVGRNVILPMLQHRLFSLFSRDSAL